MDGRSITTQLKGLAPFKCVRPEIDMCDCNETINKKLTEENSNTLLDIPMTLSMSENTIRATRLTVSTKKADSKVRKKATTIFCSYCPFCGEKYQAA